MFDRRLVLNLDWILLGLALLISLFGVITIYSAAGSGEKTYLRQIFWVGFGLVGLIFTISIDYKTIGKFAYFLYALVIAALVGVELSGKVVSGSQRWLSLGYLSIQPSEITKLIIIIILAKYYSNNKKKQPYRLYQLIIPGLVTALPCLLIYKQPDLGTAAIIAALFLILSFTAGINRKSLLILAVIGIISIPLIWSNMEDYQKNRIKTIGAGYQSIQSKIAIGSGGLLGKGFLAGTQSRLNFLPEKYTDFIFSVLAEELGFTGAVVLVILYLLLLLRAFESPTKASDELGTLIGAGVCGMLGLHIIINISMAIGLLPIVGIPLPFMSYGGSSMFTNILSIGLLLNIRMRRFLH